MTRQILLLFCLIQLLLPSGAIAQFKRFPKLISNFGSQIPGTFLIYGKTEVSNQQWKEMLAWYKLYDTNLYDKLVPDTQVWLLANDNSQHFSSYYFQHPAFKDFPLVGINQQQAIQYCAWLQKRLEEKLLLNSNTSGVKFKVRLPTEAEWEYAVRGGNEQSTLYPWTGDEIYKTEGKSKDFGKHQLNCRTGFRMDLKNLNIGEYESFHQYTTPVYSYWPNGYGLYNMVGNVAEWVSDSGISKGGSWRDYPGDCQIKSRSVYSDDKTTNSFTGFRFVIELIQTQNSKHLFIEKLTEASILNDFVEIRPGLKVSATEVSNLQFNSFIKYSGKTSFATRDSNWLEHSPYLHYLYYSKNSIYNDYPAVNMTYEAASEYCKWLTDTYNSIPKRKFKKVEFSLLTKLEWDTCARAGYVYVDFSWGGQYARNAKGCYLGNFKTNNLSYIKIDIDSNRASYTQTDTVADMKRDGVLYTGPIKSYFPNRLGLYNMSGNVAEMVHEKGLTCGGSWNARPDKLRIGSTEKYLIPASYIGFRVKMKVLIE